jgi:uncharacterized protein DUF1570
MHVLWIAVILTLQVPPPNAPAEHSETLRADRASILEREAKVLAALAKALKAGGDDDAAKQVVALLPAPASPDGSRPFVQLPEVVASRNPGLANVPVEKAQPHWRLGVDATRADSAKKLFDLAGRAASATPKRLALADACLRDVIARQPDHAEVRRLLGHVKYEGGWASPFAVSELRAGKTLHPTYGWVRKSWVKHLEKGELPENGSVAEGAERWISADQADAHHRDWANAWTIHTEHFQIRTNVPLAESIAFGRHLETLHDLFEALLADVVGDSLPLAQRFKTPGLVGEKKTELHLVSYFADRQEYVDTLRPSQPKIEESLGIYLPPTSPKSRRGHAYFFWDKGGDLPVIATLFHEVSHQLLFESGIARADAYKANGGNYWVFEGLGTYFETLQIQEDGSVRIGGLVGRRNEEAKKRLVVENALVPLKTFVQYDARAFNLDRMIFRHYQEASALTSLLMDGQGGKYRDGFLTYVRDACKGTLRRGSGHTLEERLETDYDTLQVELLAYLQSDPSE